MLYDILFDIIQSHRFCGKYASLKVHNQTFIFPALEFVIEISHRLLLSDLLLIDSYWSMPWRGDKWIYMTLFTDYENREIQKCYLIITENIFLFISLLLKLNINTKIESSQTDLAHLIYITNIIFFILE